MNSVTVQHYDAKEVFKLSRAADHTMYGYDLAKGFYNARYGDLFGSRSTWWGANAGAVQLFDKETKVPVVWNVNGTSKSVFSDVSKYINPQKAGYGSTSYGHSERICMSDLLDSYMSYREIDSHDIKNPSHPDNARSHDNQYDILLNLTNAASTYKVFLAGSGVTVKFWSERKPCDYVQTSTGEVEGGMCKDFIQQICPVGSHYGYTINQVNPAKKLIEERSKALKAAYDTDSFITNLLIGPDQLIENVYAAIDDLSQVNGLCEMTEALTITGDSSTEDIAG